MELNIGDKINKLTIIDLSDSIKYSTAVFKVYNCRCECGKIIKVRANVLRKGKQISCGCIGKHFKTKSKEFTAWNNMIGRCNNPNNISYKNYGERGITYCKEWEKFSKFYEDMGDCPKGYSLDRIDNEKGYSKENCRWATRLQQNKNRRNVISVLYEGECIDISDLARKTNIKYNTLLFRHNVKNDLMEYIENKKYILNLEDGIFYENLATAAKTYSTKRDSIKNKFNQTGRYNSLVLV